jgi:hypothetical protein
MTGLLEDIRKTGSCVHHLRFFEFIEEPGKKLFFLPSRLSLENPGGFFCLFPETVKRRIFAIIFDKDLLSKKSDYGMVRNRIKPSMQIFLRNLFVFCLTNSVSMLRHEIDVILPVRFE